MVPYFTALRRDQPCQSLDFGVQDYKKINFGCLSHPTCDTLLQPSWQTHASMENMFCLKAFSGKFVMWNQKVKKLKTVSKRVENLGQFFDKVMGRQNVIFRYSKTAMFKKPNSGEKGKPLILSNVFLFKEFGDS